MLTIFEEGLGLPGHRLAPFDREGAPRNRRPIIEDGIMTGVLLDRYEATATGVSSTGSALGSPSSAPRPGAVALSVPAGDTPEADLIAAQKCVVVTRFSGSTNPVTGDFSGVVKGGFLVDGGDRRPIKETTISGNVYSALKEITGISSERRLMYGQQLMPTFRIADVSITAG
jgi:PmbA protein